MDIKVTGITAEIMREALEQARAGRIHILGKMAETLSAPRNSVSPIAPRIVTIKIPVDKIRDVIGPGGKMIRSIIERTGVKIDVEDDGRVNVASADEAAAAKAIGIIQELTATPELNKTYMGKVQRITDFGAFVEIMPGTEGLVHISELKHGRTEKTEDVVKKGDRVKVKLLDRDERGRLRLSMKALTPKPEGEEGRGRREEGSGEPQALAAVGAESEGEGGEGGEGGERSERGDRGDRPRRGRGGRGGGGRSRE
jgi:polyribonucleotide nucleotidyltransferase